jgi:hypothetical protein
MERGGAVQRPPHPRPLDLRLNTMGHRHGCDLGLQRRGRTKRNDDRNSASNQFGGERRQRLRLILGPAVFDRERFQPARQPCHHSLSNAALLPAIPKLSLLSPCQYQKGSLLLRSGRTLSKTLKSLRNLTAMGAVLPCISENLPANRKIAGRSPRETVSPLTASSGRQSGLLGFVRCQRGRQRCGRQAVSFCGMSRSVMTPPCPVRCGKSRPVGPSGGSGRLDPFSLRTNARVICSTRFHTTDRDCARRPLASSMICLAMIPSARSSVSPKDTRVRSSATRRTGLVWGPTSKSSRVMDMQSPAKGRQ